MSGEAEARIIRASGWLALATAAFGLARLGVAAQVYAGAATGHAPHDLRGWDLALAAVAFATAATQAVVVQGLRRLLAPDSRLILTVSVAGWLGAALGAAGGGLIAARALTAAAPATSSGLLLGWLAAFLTALWVAGACAADWRRERLPAWLRVVGTLLAVLSLAASVLSPFALLAVPLGFAWWIGLGVTLLRARAGSTSA